MERYLRKLIVWYCLLLNLPLQAQKQFYVSPNGSDANIGNQAEPFKTIQKAQEAVRVINSKNPENITIYIQEGDYQLAEPLKFNAADGGQKDFMVRYVASKKEKVVIHGGVTIESWEKSESEGIYQANIKAKGFRQLYINGEKSIRARYPNVGEFIESKGWDLQGRKLILEGDFSRFNQEKGVELKLFQSWAEAFLRLDKVKVQGMSYLKYSYLSFQKNESEILFNRPYPVHKPSHRVYFENAKSLIDHEREWFFDRNESVLYYKPAVYQDLSKMKSMYPAIDTLLIIEGSEKKPVRNLVFEGLSFQYSNWDYASQHGYLNGQAGQHNYKSTPQNKQYIKRPAAAVYVANAERVKFSSNTFSNLGSTGIDLHYGVKDSLIEGNIFKDISGSAVLVGKFTLDESTEFHIPYLPKNKQEICSNVTVANNLIERVAADYSGCVGIGAGYPRGIKVVHNVIRNLPYSGISIGFGWTDQPNAMSDNFIAYNDISHVLQLMNDGAAIYTLSYQPGTKMFRNYIHDLPKPVLLGQKIICGVYCDERSGGSEEKPMVIEENIIDNGTSTMYKFNHTGIIIMKNNIQGVHHTNGQEIMKEVGLQPKYQYLLD